MRDFSCLAWGAFKLQRSGSAQEGTRPKKSSKEVTMWVATTHARTSYFVDGPTAHWVGLRLVSLKVEGCKINALADSGSQVNMGMPSYVHQHEFPILPLADLVDHPLNLVGLGGMRT